MNATDRMNAMIEDAKCGAILRDTLGWSSVYGELAASVIMKRNPNKLKQHWSVTWYLCEKRITADKARKFLES
jgi:hypothetical protein